MIVLCWQYAIDAGNMILVSKTTDKYRGVLMGRLKFIALVALDMLSLVAVFLLFVYLGMGYAILLCMGL